MQFRNLLLVSLSLLISNGSDAQSDKQEKEKARYEELKTSIDSRHYIFDAQSATAMGGRTRQLTGTYTLTVSGDSLRVNLPYYGIAYSANPGETNGGISFKSTSFTYEAHMTKKDGWFILITPKNESNASKIQLSITSGGYTTVQITSNYRQLISFYGTIIPDSKNNRP